MRRLELVFAIVAGEPAADDEIVEAGGIDGLAGRAALFELGDVLADVAGSWPKETNRKTSPLLSSLVFCGNPSSWSNPKTAP